MLTIGSCTINIMFTEFYLRVSVVLCIVEKG